MTYNLLDLYEVKSGMGNKSREDFDESKYMYKIIMFKEIFYNSKLPDIENLKTTVNLKPRELERFDVKKGDVFLTSSSETMNELAMSSVAYLDYHNTVYSGFSKRLRPKTNLTNFEYMRYWFRSKNFRNEIDKTVSMTTRANLNLSILSNIEVSLPSLKEQKAIANILSSLDDKIELNNKINQNLETLAQSLYKHWFVDFEFPNENGEPYKSSGGEMVESDLGLIPEGWEIKRIKELDLIVTDYVANGSFKSLKENVNLYEEENFAIFVRNTDLKNGIGSGVKFVDQHSYEFLSKSRLEGGEVIISNVGDVGSVYRCPSLSKPMTLGNNVIMLKSTNGTSYENYLYTYFSNYIGQGAIESITGGSAQPKFNKTDFRNLKLILPKNKVLKQFLEIVSSLYHMIDLNSDQNSKLSNSRDTLLPKLMNGEIEVPV